MNKHDAILAWAKGHHWFYEFNLPDGSTTTCDGGPSVALLHQTRLRMLLECFDSTWLENRAMTVLDVACHQGFFSAALAKRFHRLTGIDINQSSIADARLMLELKGIDNADLRCCDVRDYSIPHDVVVAFGLLYHVEDPVTLLRRLSMLARKAIVIETQLSTEWQQAQIEWGVAPNTRSVDGWFALVNDDDNREGGSSGLALVPSEAAVHTILRACGFVVRTIACPKDGHEQLARGRRAVIMGVRP